MELKDLVGGHILSGVDRERFKHIPDDDCFFGLEDCELINFVLDGETYTAIQDPEDGYRSAMKMILRSNVPVINTFVGQRVIPSLSDDGEILTLTDAVTCKPVLRVGTDRNEDYYPLWVADFMPENMAINQSVNTDEDGYVDAESVTIEEKLKSIESVIYTTEEMGVPLGYSFPTEDINSGLDKEK
jgi:hypothetical protein